MSGTETLSSHPTGAGRRVRERFGSRHTKLWMADLLFRAFPPFVAPNLRTQALRAAGFQIGRASVFWGRPRFHGTGDIARRLTIGTDSGFNAGCVFDLEDTVTIGNRVAVGHRVMFLTRDYEPGTPAQRAGDVRRAPIVVEDGAWIGARAVVLPGVTIGAGSVIGAGVAVTQDVPPNTLLSGVQKVPLTKWR
jgi:maltose O-acetyltransferase